MTNAARRVGLAVAVLGLMAGASGRAGAGIILPYHGRVTGTVISGSGDYANIHLAAGDRFVGVFDFLMPASPVVGQQRFGAYDPFDRMVSYYDGTTYLANVTADVADRLSFRLYNAATEAASAAHYDPSFVDVTQVSVSPTSFSIRTDSGGMSYVLTLTRPVTPLTVPLQDVSLGDFGQASMTWTGTFIPPIVLRVDSVTIVQTPEPSTLISAGIACAMGLGYGWRRRARPAA